MATTTASPLELSGTNVKERTMRGMIWRQFRRHRMALVGLLVLAGLVIGSWPDHPGLAEECNADDLPRLTGVPVLATIPAGGSEEHNV